MRVQCCSRRIATKNPKAGTLRFWVGDVGLFGAFFFFCCIKFRIDVWQLVVQDFEELITM